MAEATEPDNPQMLTRLVKPKVLHGTVHGNAGAEQRGPLVQGKAIGEADDEVLVDHDGIGVSSVGHGAVEVNAVVGLHHMGTVVLEALLAAVARAARPDHAAHADPVSGFELAHVAAHLRHNPDNLVAALTGDAGPISGSHR